MPHPHSPNTSSNYALTPRLTHRRQFLYAAGIALGGVSMESKPTRGEVDPAPPVQQDPLEYCNPWPPPPANPVLFAPDTTLPLRERKSAFELNSAEVDRLRKAYGLLRALYRKKPNDPRGWLRQANVHCWYCGGQAGNELNAGPEIHGSWRFLPWHRMYLYFHERILAALVKDDTFALPYWDWDNPKRRTLPPAYADPGTAVAPNPLFDPIRGVGLQEQIPDSIVGDVAMKHALLPLSFDAPGGFGGTADGPSSSPGTLENSPHGPIHIWTADPTLGQATGNIPLPDMGILATAARDPIFFAHHANIDRLWDVWLNQPVQPGQPVRTNPTDPAWARERFGFYDHHDPAAWVSISIADIVLHEVSLRYKYKGVAPHLLIARAPEQLLLTAKVDQFTLTGEGKATEQIALPDDILAKIDKPSPKRITVPPTYVLHIDGIEAPPDSQALVRVFINLPEATAKTSLDSPNFVGQLTILAKHKPAKAGMMAHKKKHPPTNAAIQLGEKQLALIKEKRSLSVQLVPFGADPSKPVKVNLTYKKIYLTVNHAP